MTKEERFALARERMLRKKEKEKEKRKAEREKKRMQGYRKYVAKIRREKKKEEEKKKRQKEREKAKKALEREKAKKKRKPGRPKKRGPKKKRKYVSKKVVSRPPRPTFDYKIVFTENGRQTGYYGVYMDVTAAYEAMEKIKEESSRVLFPRKTKSGGGSLLTEALLLEKNRFGDKENPILRNEYGRLVEQETNLEKWVILDKERINVEETFWVYGFSPKTERKTISWFMENGPFTEFAGKDDIRRVMVYLNKVVVKHDDGSFDMAILKDMSDSVRFYNVLLQYAGQIKEKRVIFLGSYSELGPKRRRLEAELVELTGWSMDQLRRRQTKK